MTNDTNPRLLPTTIPGAEILNRSVLENRDLTPEEVAEIDAICDAWDARNVEY